MEAAWHVLQHILRIMISKQVWRDRVKYGIVL